MLKYKFKYLLLMLTAAFFLSSCYMQSCTMMGFSYPPGSEIDEGDWEYAGMIVVTSNKPGSDFNISEKTARVTITDKKKNKLLDMTVKFPYCGAISHDIDEVKWDKFEVLEFTLYEKIVKNMKIKRGAPNDSEDGKFPLCRLKFEYNAKDQKFHLTERDDLGGFFRVVWEIQGLGT